MFQILKQHPSFVVALSERQDGPMKWEGGKRDGEVQNRRVRFLSRIGLSSAEVADASVAHGNTVAVAGTGGTFWNTDGLLTREKGLALAVTVADCFPVFLFDPAKEAAGILHVGWRGAEKNLPFLAVARMEGAFGSSPKDIRCGIGPGILPHHYEVQEDVAGRFPESVREEGGRLVLDLPRAITLQLLEAGMLPEHIELHRDCTSCDARSYFSYRRDRPDAVEAMMAVTGLFPRPPLPGA